MKGGVNMRKIKSCFVMVLAVLLLLTGCQTASTNQTGAEKQVLKEVLQNQTEFYDTTGAKNMKLEQLSIDDDTPLRVQKFAVLDLDGDSVQEVVLSLGLEVNENYGFQVLRYQDGAVYGYQMYYRAFKELKADGTFAWSGGAADNGFGTAVFTKEGYTVTNIAYSESEGNVNGYLAISYYVEGKKVTEQEHHAAWERQNAKPYAVWYDFTDANITEALG